jgi:hypothetical protein
MATNLSSEVSTWFIDDSSKETSSSSSVSSSYESKESLLPPMSSESRSLFLTAEVSASSSNLRLPLLSLDVILLTRESVGREGESDRLDERECGGRFCDLGTVEEEEMKSAELGIEVEPAPIDIY